jgi:hypothetical protein
MGKETIIESMLLDLYMSIGMDRPSNHEDIREFVIDDVNETADPEDWHSGDVAIAFRRWIESKGNVENDYFQVIHKGYQTDVQREQVYVKGGENANIYIIKTDEGFIIDVYGEGDHIDSMTIWDDQLDPEDPDKQEIHMSDINDFIDEWGKYADELCAELGCKEIDPDSLVMGDYFYHEESKKWLPKYHINYSEFELRIADKLLYGF